MLMGLGAGAALGAAAGYFFGQTRAPYDEGKKKGKEEFVETLKEEIYSGEIKKAIDAKANLDKYGAVWERKAMILFGPPGAGKGTHGPKIEKKLKLPQLSTGDMLRAAVAAGTEVGKQAKAAMDAGALVTDEIVIGIIRDRIAEDDCKTGFILDGFPRTITQAKALDEMLAKTEDKVMKVVALEVPDEQLEERICGRWIHKASGRSYHTTYNPPKSMKKGKDGKVDPASMKDDATGEALMQRSDDTAEALVNRLKGYHSDTTPVLDHYAHCVSRVDAGGKGDIDAVWAKVENAL